MPLEPNFFQVPEGYGFLVANTLVKHNLVDSAYNERRKSCENARDVIAGHENGIRMLRDVDRDMLEKYRGKMSRTDYRRALHVIGENERVMQGVEFLRKGNISAFGKLLFESHASSRENFENSCPELDALVEIASTMPECLGARLSGGGFGGITIHLIKLSDAERYQKRLETAYYAMTGKEIKCVLCSIGNGATVFLPL